ncbi:MAG: hypothetical protein GXX96_02835 [Planctomycetaceae bacterium]|nr:hypothetical protein [Planctomycetaceae bacterium]
MRRWMVTVGGLLVVGSLGCGIRPADGVSPVNRTEQGNDQVADTECASPRDESRVTLPLDVWKEKYAQQQEAKQWPGNLSNDFCKWTAAHPGDVEIPPSFRDEYRIAVREHASQLGQIIKRRSTDAKGNEGIVEWNDGDFARIQGGVYWTVRPLSVEIRLAQEDLWACEAILGSIAKTNEQVETTSHHNAAIRRIETLEVAQPASIAVFMANRGESEWTCDDLDESDEGHDTKDSTAERNPESAGYDSGEYEEDVSPNSRSEEWVAHRLLTGRYVNLEQEPLAADSQPYAEFNLLPVHVLLVVEPRRLPDLLANLANCPLPVEVTHLRVAGVKQEVSSALHRTEGNDETGKNPAPVEILGRIRLFKCPP